MESNGMQPALKGWMTDAACSNRPYEWFELPDVIPPGLAEHKKLRDLIRKGQSVCRDECTVRSECVASALAEDLTNTVRGGLWPLFLGDRAPGRPVIEMPAIPYAPTGRVAPNRKRTLPEVPGEPDVCPNGHDKQIVGYYNRQCWECRRLSKVRLTLRRSQERKDARALLWAAWLAKDQCDQGHDLGPAEGRVATQRGGYCPDCKRIHRNGTQKRKRREGETVILEHDSSTPQLLNA